MAPIAACTFVWKYWPGEDVEYWYSVTTYPKGIVTRRRPRGHVRHFGFESPTMSPGTWILPGDAARWMNFSDTANLKMGLVDEHGERVLVAARDIAAGEELTVPPESDLDYKFKMRGVRK